MRKPLLFISIFWLLATNFTYGQERCGTIFDPSKVSPEVRQSVESFYSRVENPELQAMAPNNFNINSGVVLIPIVVHVVYNTAIENISDAQICSQIEALNQDFARRNPDRINTPAQFAGVAGNTEIQFYLATRDPNGNATSGITRTSTSVTSFDDDDGVKSNASGGRNPWDTNRFLNIWVADLNPGLLGYAQFPWDYAAKPNTDGVVVDFRAFGTTGAVMPPYHLGRTTSHEVGHWLGLRHIWGDDGGACTGSDGVNDTPNQGGNYTQLCPTGNMVSCGSNDMYMNYMDYTNDACMNLFTNGQKAVMRATLNTGGYRSNFSYSLPIISNSPEVCTSNKNYTLLNIPAGITVTGWSVTPANLFNVSSGTGTTATLRAANSSSAGQATLTFNIRGLCGIATVTKSLQVGKLQPGPITFGLIDPIMGKLYAAVSPVPGATSYNWYIDGVLTDSHSSGAQMQIPRNRCGMEYDVSVEAVNSCGVSLRTHRNAYVPCDEYYIISPNPASGLVTVSLDNNQLTSMGNKPFDQIRIYDMEGNLKISQKFDKAESASLDVSKLINGTYLIEISAGVHNERKQLLIQK